MALVVAGLGLAATLGLEPDDTEEGRVAAAERGDASVREFLEPWYDAVRQHERAPADLVVVGDSISEGALLEAPVLEHRMVRLLQEQLRRRVGATGGVGYLPAYYADWFTPDDAVRSGTPPREDDFASWGLGGRALVMPGGSTLTYPALPATRARVWFGRTSYLAGAAKVYVDGVDRTAAGTLSTGEPSGPLISGSVPEGTLSGLWWESPDLGPGEHRVQVASVLDQRAFVHTGVELLDGDADSGIHVYDGAHSGATAANFAHESVEDGHWADVAAVDPQLILVNLGSNPEPDYAGMLEVVVQRALAVSDDVQVLVVDGYEPGSWSSEAWAEVRRARYEVAARYSDRVAVFDLAAHWPRLAKDGSTNQGLMTEDAFPLHPNAAGNRLMADILADLLTPPDP